MRNKKTTVIFGLFIFFLLSFPHALAQETLRDEDGEKSFILGIEKDYPPFLFFEDNQAKGITYDYAKLMSEKIGWTLKSSPPMQLQELLDLAKKEEITLLSDISKTQERDEYLEFSEPFLETPAVVIGRNENQKIWGQGENKGLKIAVGKGYGVVSYLKENYPQAIYLELPSDQDVIQAVALGASDVGVLDTGSLSYLLQKEPLSNIIVLEETAFKYFLSFAVPQNRAAEITYINEAIKKITPEEKNEIAQKWLPLLPRAEDIKKTYFFWIIGTFIAFTMLSAIWVISLKKGIKKKTDELRAVNRNLDRAVEEKVKEANEARKEAEKKSWQLEKAKKAMLNILEDLKEERQHLAEGKAKDDAMLKSIADGFVATDKEGKILLVNDGFEKILGWSAKEAIGKKVTNLVPLFDESGKRVKTSERLIFESLKSNITKTLGGTANNFYQKKNGERFQVSITVSPVELNGKLIGAVEIFRDITKEKEIDKAKTEFVSLASHQLRTPLTSIKIFLELMQKKPEKNALENQKNYLHHIKTANDRMIQLVNDLLNVSRLEAGRIAVNPEEKDLEQLIEENINELRAQARKKNIQLHFLKNKEKIPKILIDEALFHEVMVCFLSNALRYSKTRGGKVEISTLKTKNEYLISIKDNGIGIDPKEQSNIFQKFFRADNAIQKEADGSGLGLYMAQMIMKASGGKVSFKSSLGKGTTFFIHLPLTGMNAHEGDRKIAE